MDAFLAVEIAVRRLVVKMVKVLGVIFDMVKISGTML